jgi:manganese efflux pump family protein
VLKLLLFVVPLGLDTFAVSAALGTRGETAMPVVGLLLGRGLGALIGGAADYAAGAALLALGGYLLAASEHEEGERLAGAIRPGGVALLALGLSISLDELAMGFTIGLLHLSLAAATILIGAQAFLVAQLGLRLGARLGEAAPGWAERAAGIALLGLGALVLAERVF